MSLAGRTAAAALALLLAAGPTAWAAECAGISDLSAEVAVGRVTAAPRVNFLRGGPACPAATPACAERAYLVPGDLVLLGSGQAPGFLCTSFVNGRGAVRTGWLPAEAVAMQPPGPAGRPEDWTGGWTRDAEARLTIRPGPRPGTLGIAGEATYGAGDPDRVRRGVVHIGEIAATPEVAGPALGFTVAEGGTLPYAAGGEYDCRAQMRLAGPFLLVEDNGACGGANVSFTGIYRRDHR